MRETNKVDKKYLKIILLNIYMFKLEKKLTIMIYNIPYALPTLPRKIIHANRRRDMQ